MNRAFLGIDTSNYTTSAALCSPDGEILLSCRIPLPVKEGERGLRQSDAVFHHVRNLPLAAEKVGEYLRENSCTVAAVGYSAYPRSAEGSYMPCFLAGESSAAFSSHMLGTPLYKTSHQVGHIAAALYSSLKNANRYSPDAISEFVSHGFIAFHVSGGTTDVLLCEPDESEIINVTQIGGSEDINGGQAVDRAGVMMGLSFPCGAEMDKNALMFDGKREKMKPSVNGLWCNLSGIENRAALKYRTTHSIPETSAFVLGFISDTLEKITQSLITEYRDLPIIYAGGVMSSKYIRAALGKYGSFADAEFSSDNAAGVALVTREKYMRNTAAEKE